jgi:hypothetical protein
MTPQSTQPIVYVDASTIREGKLDELTAAMDHLAAWVEANVPRLVSYAFYLDAERKQMTVVAVHPDSDSLEYHMDAGREEFRKFASLIELARIDVYGRVSDAVVERLEAKAAMLGGAPVAVHEFHAGFSR